MSLALLDWIFLFLASLSPWASANSSTMRVDVNAVTIQREQLGLAGDKELVSSLFHPGWGQSLPWCSEDRTFRPESFVGQGKHSSVTCLLLCLHWIVLSPACQKEVRSKSHQNCTSQGFPLTSAETHEKLSSAGKSQMLVQASETD